MGGNAFPHVSSVTLDVYSTFEAQLLTDLTQLGFQNILPVGSTGKKSVMGDLDFAASAHLSSSELFSQATKVFGHKNVKKTGGSTISLAYPYDVDTRVQVDVMLGAPKFLAWSRFGVSDNPAHPHFSYVKGSVRNVFLGTVMWWVTRELLPDEQGELDRTRYVLDYDHGLQKIWQTLRNKRPDGPVCKNWKTMEREDVSADPEFICRFITGEDDTTSEHMLMLGDIVRQLRLSQRFANRVDAIIDDFCERLSGADLRVVGNLEETINNVRKEVMR